MTCMWVRLAGHTPLTEVAPHTPPTWETLADGGIGEVSFALSLSPKASHQLLQAGVKVEVMLGAQPLATALMSEPDRTTWQVKAQGLSASSRKVAALSEAGVFSRDVGQVILYTTATTGWWDVKNPNGVGGGGVVAGDSIDPQMVGDLLDSYAMQLGGRWGVDGEARLYLRADPTSPTYFVTPDVAAFGMTDEGSANQLVLRYDGGVGGYATTFYPASAPATVRHEVVDLTEEGVMTEAQAQTMGAGLIARGKAEMRWTNGVELTRDQITQDGVPAFLPLVTAGQMARATGLPANFTTAAPWLDVVIGKTRYTAGEDTIYLEPINTAPRTLADVIAAA